MRIERFFYILSAVLISIIVINCSDRKVPSDYKGKPYEDSLYKDGAQVIPGKIQCEFYDLGGEGIAYHDSDSTNSGSGGLNPVDGTRLNEFRVKESVDISYTKSNGVDDNPFNMVVPKMNQLYVGWTEPGEWLNYTVNLQAEGIYKVGLMYTSNRGGLISLSTNGTDVSGNLPVNSTYVDADTLSWRQWHHWNYIDSLTTLSLEQGMQVLTLKTIAEGNMNYDYLDFKLIKE